MKKIFAFLLIIAAVFSVASISVMAEEEISVVVDGEKVEFDVKPVIEGGRTLVPARAVFEKLGALVDWDKDENKVIVKKGDVQVTVKVNENALMKNGEKIELDVPATITDGRTLVPVRAISEAYGCDVSWNAAKKTVVVISDANLVEALNVNGISVPVAYYKMWLNEAAQSASASLGGKLEDVIAMWELDLGGKSLGSQISEMALSEIKVRKIMRSKAEKLGIKLSEEQEKLIAENVEQMIKDESVQKNKIAKEIIKAQLEDMDYVSNYTEKLMSKQAITTKNVREYLDENYVRAKHILIVPEENENGEVTEEAMLSAKKFAEEILLKAKRGADFDMLVKEFGKDPGMETNPGGYLFTKGEMVAPFEKAAFELGVNKISGVVETDYGYHIIKRVKSDYSDEEIENFKTTLSQEKASEEFEKVYEEATITVNENIVNLLVPSVQ